MLEEVADALKTDNRRGLLGGAHIGLLACAAAVQDLEVVALHFNEGRKLLTESGMIDPDVAWPAEIAGNLLAAAGERSWAQACWEFSLNQWEALRRADDAERLRSLIKNT